MALPRRPLLRWPLSVVLLALVLPPAGSQTPSSISAAEDAVEQAAREGLLAQRDAITNWPTFASANGITGWDDTTPVCSWGGVTCAANASTLGGFTVQLGCVDDSTQSGGSLQGFCAARAVGTLAPQLAATPSLTSLGMVRQALAGTLPEAWAGASSFAALGMLDLSDNALTGTLPAAWGNGSAFPQLSDLALNNNSLGGTLPSGWAAPDAFPSLASLELMNNSLRGSLPATWAGAAGGFAKLSILHLAHNRLNGSIPDNITLPSVTILDFGHNRFEGALPTFAGGASLVPDLSVLIFKNNTLSGTLPESYGAGALFALTILDVTNNSLSSGLPGAWAQQLRDMQRLYMAGNELDGSIPPSWTQANFPRLITLDLTDNLVCGTVPAGLDIPVCADGTDDCVTGNTCPPDPNPSPSPSPGPLPVPSPAPAPAEASSSDVGVIVGAVIGGVAGVVLLGVLGFLVWRRRRPPPAAGHPAENGKASKLDSAELEAGRAASSTATSGNRSWQQDLPDAASDPVISFIDSHLASIRLTRASMRPVPAAASAGAGAAAGAAAAGAVAGAPVAAATALPSGGKGTSLTPEVRQWEVEWEQIRVQRLIGRGAFGRVYLAHWRQTPVAAKVLTSAEQLREQDLILPEEVLQELQEEAAVMTRMRHPNIVSFLGLCTLPPCIVTEYCAQGSLFDVLRAAHQHPERGAALTWTLRLEMALDAARGLLYLHARSPPIIHRDLKSPNLLVDRDWNVKIADFNLSHILGDAERAGPDNPCWMAPEVVLADAEASAASDVYALGLVLYELLTWHPPWPGANPFQIRYALMTAQRPPVPPRGALPGPDTLRFAGLDAYCTLMRECWAEEPEARPTCDDVVLRLSRLLEQQSMRTGSGGGGTRRGPGGWQPGGGSGSGSAGAGDDQLKRWGTAPVM